MCGLNPIWADNAITGYNARKHLSGSCANCVAFGPSVAKAGGNQGRVLAYDSEVPAYRKAYVQQWVVLRRSYAALGLSVVPAL